MEFTIIATLNVLLHFSTENVTYNHRERQLVSSSLTPPGQHLSPVWGRRSGGSSAGVSGPSGSSVRRSAWLDLAGLCGGRLQKRSSGDQLERGIKRPEAGHALQQRCKQETSGPQRGVNDYCGDW